MKIFNIIFILCLFFLFSCNNKKSTQSLKLDDEISTNKITENKNIIIDNIRFPNLDDTKSTLIYTSCFHGDEVDSNINGKEYLGLFYSQNKYYLKKCVVLLNKVFDPVLDEDSSKSITGIEVNTSISDSNIILLTENFEIKEKDVVICNVPSEILPGDTVLLNYLNNKYILYATGINFFEENLKENQVLNYKLYISLVSTNKTQTELLVATPNFDDSMTKILFAGDLDGDNILDFIIDTSTHYNADIPTLYLSSKSSKNHFLKALAYHMSVGC